MTTTLEAHCSNPSCFEIVTLFTQDLHIFISECGHKVLETLRNTLRGNERQRLEAFYAKGVFGIFSEPPLQREGLNSPEATLAKMKKAAQNFCLKEAGRKGFACCHFKVSLLPPFLGLFLVPVIPTSEKYDHTQLQICSQLQSIQAEECEFG